MEPNFPNHDPGHYLNGVCTILVAYRPGHNWAYYAAPHDAEYFAGAVQARAVKEGCRSSSFGDRYHLRHVALNTGGFVFTPAGRRFIDGDPAFHTDTDTDTDRI